MILSYFEELVAGIESRLQADPEGTSARGKLALEIAMVLG